MSDGRAYIEFRGWKGNLGYIKLIFDSGYIFLKIYRCLKFLYGYSILRPLVKILSWFYCRIYSCEISLNARIEGAVIFPHPIGIVIGDGVILNGINVIYQNVTLGQNKKSYPVLSACIIYPNSVIAGGGEYECEIFGALSRVVV
jgi:serine O-acetyltransferase